MSTQLEFPDLGAWVKLLSRVQFEGPAKMFHVVTPSQGINSHPLDCSIFPVSSAFISGLQYAIQWAMYSVKAGMPKDMQGQYEQIAIILPQSLATPSY